MNLNIFIKNLSYKKFIVKDNISNVEVYYDKKLCAKIFMNKDFAYWIDTSGLPLGFRQKLVANVNEFALTPYPNRRNTMIARHSNHMYVKSIDMETYYNSFTAKVEMTGSEEEADRFITPEKQMALAKLFGREIHYVKVIE